MIWDDTGSGREAIMGGRMKRLFCAAALLSGIVLCAAPVGAAAEGGKPALSEDGYYELDSREDLDWFAGQVNRGKSKLKGRLTADIAMGGEADPWVTPIGTSANLYTGIFDGGGHVLQDFCARTEGSSLFGYTFKAGIRGIHMTGSMNGSGALIASAVET
ncbi:MAG TPA: hypothetical protein DF613_15340, partial [Lachnospiraceae bacterium]|nr:hypothetical protein [Lachnospiraceae bacterium]